VEIDEIDVKILRLLIEDARRTLTDIAKQCNLSAVAILNRVKRLKTEGVITGTVLISNMKLVGMYPASIDILLNSHQEAQIAKVISEQMNLVLLSRVLEKDNLVLFVVGKSMQKIDDLKQTLKGQPGVRKVTVSFWNTPNLSLENIQLQSTRG